MNAATAWIDANAWQLITIAAILIGTWLVTVIVQRSFERYGARLPSAIPPVSLISTIARIVVAIVGLTILMSQLGISIAPIITALGVGGLAVALALRDTLANLFSGMHLLSARQIRPGDYVKFETWEGRILDITLRNTVIRDLAGSTVLVSNEKLSQMTITNWNADGLISFAIPFSVPRATDIEAFGAAAVAAANAAGAKDARLRLVSMTHDAIACALRMTLEAGADPFAVRDAVLATLSGVHAETSLPEP